MIENRDMIRTCLERRIGAMVMIGQKEGTRMIEKLFENVIGIGSALEIVTATVIGNEIETGIGTDIGKTKTDMQIIVGTGTVSLSMIMIGIGDGHQRLTASHDYHRRRNIALDLEMLIMGRGDDLPQTDLSDAFYTRTFLLKLIYKKESVTAETLCSSFTFDGFLNLSTSGHHFIAILSTLPEFVDCFYPWSMVSVFHGRRYLIFGI